MLLTYGHSDLRMSCSHQAPGLTFQTSSTLYFHRTLSPSFPSFPPVLRHCKRHSLVSSPPLSIVNPHVNMAAISFEHVNTGFQDFLLCCGRLQNPTRPRFAQGSFRHRQGEMQKPYIGRDNRFTVTSFHSHLVPTASFHQKVTSFQR